MFHMQNYQSSHYVSARSLNFASTKIIWISFLFFFFFVKTYL